MAIKTKMKKIVFKFLSLAYAMNMLYCVYICEHNREPSHELRERKEATAIVFVVRLAHSTRLCIRLKSVGTSY